MTARPLTELVAPDWAEALAPVPAGGGRSGPVPARRDRGRPGLSAGRRSGAAGVQPAARRRAGADRRAGPVPDAGTSGRPVVLGGARGDDRSRGASPTSIASSQDDLGIEPCPHGDLSGWFEQGVLLLNRVLTVQPGRSGSHRGRGWEQVTQRAIEVLAARGGPLVAILWGRDAQNLIPMLGGVPYIASAHPSPLSARSGFFGSRPFSRANEHLVRAGAEPIDWTQLPPQSAALRLSRDGSAEGSTRRRGQDRRRFRSATLTDGSADDGPRRGSSSSRSAFPAMRGRRSSEARFLLRQPPPGGKRHRAPRTTRTPRSRRCSASARARTAQHRAPSSVTCSDTPSRARRCDGSAGEGLVEVGDQVGGVLDADAEPDQVRRAPRARCRRRRRGSSGRGAR